jgi:hypothetical protein
MATASLSPAMSKAKLKDRHEQRVNELRFDISSTARTVHGNPEIGMYLLDCKIEHMAACRRLLIWKTERAQMQLRARAFTNPVTMLEGKKVYIGFLGDGRLYCSYLGFAANSNVLQKARGPVRFCSRLKRDEQISFLQEVFNYLCRYK